MEMRNDPHAEFEIDVSRLCRALKRRAWRVVLGAVLCAAVVLLGTFILVKPLYRSDVVFHVSNTAASGESSAGISSGDISASRSLVQSYIVILNTRETLNAVIDHAGLEYAWEQLEKMISAEAVENTEMFRVTVTGPDPREAEQLASSVASVLPGRICGILAGTSVRIVDSAVVPSRSDFPCYGRIGVIAFLVGLVLAVGCVILRELGDAVIRRESDLDRYGYPVLASVPELESRGGRAVAEACSLLRVKLCRTAPEGDGCRVIGVTSALAGEGKSITAANLARSLSRTGSRTLLIDCDMRRDSPDAALLRSNGPGLSEYLTGCITREDLIRRDGAGEGEVPVIRAGRMLSDPVELLGSRRMEELLAYLRGQYAYIILDLPAVAEAGDALAVASGTDGMLLVVRGNVCDRASLDAAIRELEFMKARILGVVFNCPGESVSRHSHR